MIPSSLHHAGRTLVAAAGLAALLALPAAAKEVTGTNSPETLTGTAGKDRLTGLGGNDRLEGQAGSDTYVFDDGWGTDTLEEKPTFKVNGKKVPGGSDTLHFQGYAGGKVQVSLIPQWRGVDPNLSAARAASTGDAVALGAARVENVVGSPGNDDLVGGAGSNRLDSGGGPDDILGDFGGWDDGAGGFPELPPSDDTYVGVAANTGFVTIQDWGGADAVDLRPLRLDQVFLSQVDCDTDPERECLDVITGVGAGRVRLIGQFGEFFDQTGKFGLRGRIETLRFADVTVSFAPTGRRADGAATVDGMTVLGKAETPRQQELARNAPALANEAARHAVDLVALGEAANTEARGIPPDGRQRQVQPKGEERHQTRNRNKTQEPAAAKGGEAEGGPAVGPKDRDADRTDRRDGRSVQHDTDAGDPNHRGRR